MLDNLVLKGDNLDLMSKLTNYGYNNNIDLIYVDPPFATNRTFIIGNGRTATISSEKAGDVAYIDNFTLDSYLSFIRPRLEIMYELLSSKGSLYFHIDYKIGHYIKVMLDNIFGFNSFISDITRIKCNPKNFKRRNYSNIKDMILFYTKTSDYIWNDIELVVTDCDIKKRYSKIDEKGRYTTVPMHAPGETINGDTSKEFMGQLPPIGRHWRYSPTKLQAMYAAGLIEISKSGNMRIKNYAENHMSKKAQDIWEYKDSQHQTYPTQKNQDMLDYIVANSSEKSSIVLDCFCGSGSTLVSACKLGRNFIGIDESEVAIKQTYESLKCFTDINIESELCNEYTFAKKY